MFIRLALLMILCLSISVQATQVKYLFLFIGDGMSIAQQNVSEQFLKSQGRAGLLMNQFPVNAITSTSSANSYITDSAASGTAIACGVKTQNGVLGLDSQGNSVPSIAVEAKKKGLRVGLITTVTLNHATPAAFYAHNKSRKNVHEIGLDMIASKFDLFAGGGLAKSKTAKDDLCSLAQNSGIKLIKTAHAMRKLNSKSTLPIYIIAEDSKGAMPYAIDANPKMPSLAEITAKSIELLENPKGFFLMVEGGKIDWACHNNDMATTVHETIAFDDAIKVAYKFAQKYPKETLIVITADHETSGLTLGHSSQPYKDNYKLLALQKTSSELVYKKYMALRKDNKELNFNRVKPLLSYYYGLKFPDSKDGSLELNSFEIANLESAFLLSTKQRDQLATEDRKALYGGLDPLIITAQKILANRAGLACTTYAHSAMPVKTSAWGPLAYKFSLAADNTLIAKIFREIILDF